MNPGSSRRQAGFAAAAMSLLVLLGIAGCGKDRAPAAKEVKPPLAPPPEATAARPAIPAADTVVVEVNGQQLTAGEVETRVRRVAAMQNWQKLPPETLTANVRALQSDLVNSFIAQVLFLQEADRTGITVDEKEQAEGIEDLKRVGNFTSLEDMLTKLRTTEQQLRANLVRQTKIAKLLEKLTAAVPPPTDDEVAAYYRDNPAAFVTPEAAHVRHILIRCPTNAPLEVAQLKQASAEACRERVVKGEDLADVAKTSSECPSSTSGGDLGWLSSQQPMAEEFKTAMFSQQPGEVGKVLRTPSGFHVMQVLERKPAGTRTLEEVKGRIMEQLLRKKRQPVVNQFLEGLMAKATVKYGEGVRPPAPPAPKP